MRNHRRLAALLIVALAAIIASARRTRGLESARPFVVAARSLISISA